MRSTWGAGDWARAVEKYTTTASAPMAIQARSASEGHALLAMDRVSLAGASGLWIDDVFMVTPFSRTRSVSEGCPRSRFGLVGQYVNAASTNTCTMASE